MRLFALYVARLRGVRIRLAGTLSRTAEVRAAFRCLRAGNVLQLLSVHVESARALREHLCVQLRAYLSCYSPAINVVPGTDQVLTCQQQAESQRFWVSF